MAINNLLRLGPDIYDLDGKDSACFWINPDGKIYIRKSFSNAVCGWKLSGKKLVDYWGREWFEIIPSNSIPMGEIIFS